MAKLTNKNDLEQIYQRLDQLASFIEKSFNEIEDVSDIRSIVEDLRANLLKTIDERIEYIIGKQRDICDIRLSQIENKIKNITSVNKEELAEIKAQLLREVSNLKEDLTGKFKITNEKIGTTDDRISTHLKDKINWKQAAAPAIITAFVSIALMVAIALADKYFGWNLLDILQKVKP